MPTNETQIQETANHLKYSKWGIVSVVYFILNLIGLPVYKVSFSSYVNFTWELFLCIIELIILWYIVKHVKKTGLRGLKMTVISFYGVLVVNIIVIITTLALIAPSKEIEKFALEKTAIVMSEDLTNLKSLATKDFYDQLKYENDMTDFKDAIRAAGKIEECKFVENSYSKAVFGIYPKFKGYRLGTQGEYHVRCFGTTGYIDLENTIRKEGGEWKLFYLLYTSSNPELNKQNTEGGQ